MMRFPEIEHGLLSTEYNQRLYLLEASSTDIDLLEIAQAPSAAVNWQQGLNHDTLLKWFQRSSAVSKKTGLSVVRTFFLNSNFDLRTDFYSDSKRFISAVDPRTHLLTLLTGLKLHRSTLEWLQTQFDLPVLFLECIVNISKWAKTGNGCFFRFNSEGKICRIDILYRLGAKGGATHIWASHQIAPKVTTYFISNCPKEAKDRIVGYALSPRFNEFYRPLVVDSFLADVCCWHFKAEMEDARRYLLSYEYYGTSQIPSEDLTESFESLHRLSQTWHILHEDMIDFEERISFLLDVCTKLEGAYTDKGRIATSESIAFLASRTRIWRRWVANYNTRTKIRIDLFFNLAIQNDNRNNIEIAELTKDIAQESRKDSSSMITIAVLTMLFLPGTFVSAIFSMVFFYSEKDGNGNVQLVMMHQWWYFLAITIGLTVVVVLTWLVWQRLQVRKLSQSRRATDSRIRLKKAQHPKLHNKGIQLQVRTPSLTPQQGQVPYYGRHFDRTIGAVDPALSYQF